MAIFSFIASNDAKVLLFSRFLRLFAYGFLSVILVLYLTEIGLNLTEIGILMTLTLIGDTLISLLLTVYADRLGRKRMLIIGSILMMFAGLVFSITNDFYILLIAAIIGVISPTGNEVGPFLAIEQAALSQITPLSKRTALFAWFNLFAALSIALGSLAAGFFVQWLQYVKLTPLESYKAVIIGYALFGGILAMLFCNLTPVIEVVNQEKISLKLDLGITKSKKTVLGLAALFALDAFAGGFMMQSLIAYWFYIRFQVEPAALGSIFFGANLLAGFSSLAASSLANRFGLINTMVFTHIPSNILLILVPFMPTVELAVVVLFLRFSISQMDVPTRQSYLMAVVNEHERSAAAGITGVARTLGAALAPVIASPLLASSLLMNLPFIIAGLLKLIYDGLLYYQFRELKPKE